MIKLPDKSNEVRRSIDALVDPYHPEIRLLLSDLDVFLLEKRDVDEDKRFNRDCHWYTFGETRGNFSVPWSTKPDGYIPTDTLQEAAAVVYLDYSDLMYGSLPHVVHSGIIHPASRGVVSKWGYRDVFEHDIWRVPTCYGTHAQLLKSCSPEEEQTYYRSKIKALDKDQR